MNAACTRYIREHSDATPEEIAAALAADRTTATNLNTDALSGYLTATGILGPFLLYKDGSLPGQLAPFRIAFATLDYILSHLRGRVENGNTVGGFVRTTDPGIALQMEQMMGGFHQAGLLTGEQRAGFVNLAGGYLYGPPSERPDAEEVGAYREALAAEEEQAARQQQLRDAATVLRQRINAGAVRALGLVGDFDTRVMDGDLSQEAPSWDALKSAFAGTE